MSRSIGALLALSVLAMACGKDDKEPQTKVTDPSVVPEVSADDRVRLLGVGEAAPDFTMEAHDGRTITLSQVQGPVILYFYPKDETPG